MKLTLVDTCQVNNRLGEGVLWHDEDSTLWWTDIHGSKLFCWHWPSKELTQWATPERLTAFHIVSSEPLLLRVSFASGFALYWPKENRYEWLARPESDNLGNRFNDGRLDRQGRFWSGTMVEEEQHSVAAGQLYRLDHDGCKTVVSDLHIPNTLCWSNDSQFMFHADSPTQEILRYQFDAETGEPSQPEVFATIEEGVPDGAFVDAHDRLWVAVYDAGCVLCFSAGGELLHKQPLPVSLPTCVCVGGPNDDLLFVTSAREGLSDKQLAEQPLAGALFVYQISE